MHAPQSDTWLLARAVQAEVVAPGMDVLNVCTGSGALAVLAARMGRRVLATDISWRAVLTARLNAARAGQRVRGPPPGPVPALGAAGPSTRCWPPPVRARQRCPSPAPRGGPGVGRRDGRYLVDRICARTPRCCGRAACC